MTRSDINIADSGEIPYLLPRWPRLTNTVLAIVTFVVNLVIMLHDMDRGPAREVLSMLPLPAIVFYATGSLLLFWRTSHPLTVLGGMWVLAVICTVFGYETGPVAMVVALYSAGRYAEGDRKSYIGVAAVMLRDGFEAFYLQGLEGMELNVLAMEFLLIAIIWYAGRRVRSRGVYMQLLHDRARQLEREQDQEARRAVEAERARIARELHDIVAHQVSMMTVQAGAAKTVALNDPETARRSMEAVETAGRQALNELRHLMDVLRPEAEQAGLSPQPGLADIPELVDHVRQAGLDISLELEIDGEALPARVGLSAYRIVQEALTNVLKHAGPDAETRVRLTGDEGRIIVEVTDNGQGATILPSSGHGLHGMRERAQQLGGHLTAGPLAGGGFRVVADLPVKGE